MILERRVVTRIVFLATSQISAECSWQAETPSRSDTNNLCRWKDRVHRSTWKTCTQNCIYPRGRNRVFVFEAKSAVVPSAVACFLCVPGLGPRVRDTLSRRVLFVSAFVPAFAPPLIGYLIIRGNYHPSFVVIFCEGGARNKWLALCSSPSIHSYIHSFMN